jgi:beta-glucosidase
MIYGETPYAEGEGDINSLDFSSSNFNIIKDMRNHSNKEIPIISLFITGRPLIVDEELDLSNAFVTIWHPGTAVEGINDVIFSNINNSINYDFTGKLPYSWPSNLSINPLNIGEKDYNPLFEYGYGLSYQN